MKIASARNSLIAMALGAALIAFIDAALSDTQWTFSQKQPERWTKAESVWFHGWWKYPWAVIALSKLRSGNSVNPRQLCPAYSCAAIQQQPLLNTQTT